jgi:hypothetical protein
MMSSGRYLFTRRSESTQALSVDPTDEINDCFTCVMQIDQYNNNETSIALIVALIFTSRLLYMVENVASLAYLGCRERKSSVGDKS